MNVWTWSDQLAGRLARAGATLSQAGLVALGVHLAADQVDDRVLQVLSRTWADAPANLAPSVALVIELAADALLITSFLLTPRDPRVREWRPFLSVRVAVLPLSLAGVLLAGAWSLAMATEDLLPPSTFSHPAAILLGLAAVLRCGWPAWSRALTALEPTARRTDGLASAIILAPVALLAWTQGVPIWGWLP